MAKRYWKWAGTGSWSVRDTLGRKQSLFGLQILSQFLQSWTQLQDSLSSIVKYQVFKFNPLKNTLIYREAPWQLITHRRHILQSHPSGQRRRVEPEVSRTDSILHPNWVTWTVAMPYYTRAKSVPNYLNKPVGFALAVIEGEFFHRSFVFTWKELYQLWAGRCLSTGGK